MNWHNSTDAEVGSRWREPKEELLGINEVTECHKRKGSGGADGVSRRNNKRIDVSVPGPLVNPEILTPKVALDTLREESENS